MPDKLKEGRCVLAHGLERVQSITQKAWEGSAVHTMVAQEAENVMGRGQR